MKYIKTYERAKNNIKKIKVGEYVLIYLNNDRYKSILKNINYEKYVDFFRNNIGKIISAKRIKGIKGEPGYEYEVKFDNSPLNNAVFTWFANEDQIIAHSKIREEVETKMNLNKYNL